MLVDDIGVAAKDRLAARGFPVDSARRVLPGFVAKDPARRPETSVPVVGPGRVAVALPATADRLGPRLQFYDVVFGIGHVAPGHPSAVRRYQGHNLADGLATRGQDGLAGSGHILNLERDVGESEPFGGAGQTLLRSGVAVDLERWPICPMPR
jgi:hypothetical protein